MSDNNYKAQYTTTKQALFEKLLKVQKEVGAVTKDKENPYFNSNYADINNYIDVLKPLLTKHKLVVMQPLMGVGEYGEQPALQTIVYDAESGESVWAVVPLPADKNPQKMGSSITYFRRYALQSFFCMQAEDDDANLASKKSKSVHLGTGDPLEDED